jgi:TolB-like protein
MAAELIGELQVISRTSIMTYMGTRKSLTADRARVERNAVVEGTVLFYVPASRFE